MTDIPQKVSVAIATYNRAAMVREAVEAALGQSLRPLEVVVSDDASTDGTQELFSNWLKESPELFKTEKHGGVHYLRQEINTKGVINWNRAIDATTGDFIAWCSDDDRFLPGHLQASVAYLQAHPGVGLVHSGFVDSLETVAVSRREVRPLRSVEPLLVDRASLVGYIIRYYDWPFHPSTIVMRRSLWKKIGPFDPRFALADTDWFVRAALESSVALLPRHGALNRRHPGNWSNRVGSARMQCEIYEIVNRAIRQVWPRQRWRQAVARRLWTWNVKARLALTIWARIRSGQKTAASVAWQALARQVGGSLPRRVESWGERLIESWADKRKAALAVRLPATQMQGDSLRETVSPP